MDMNESKYHNMKIRWKLIEINNCFIPIVTFLKLHIACSGHRVNYLHISVMTCSDHNILDYSLHTTNTIRMQLINSHKFTTYSIIYEF